MCFAIQQPSITRQAMFCLPKQGSCKEEGSLFRSFFSVGIWAERVWWVSCDGGRADPSQDTHPTLPALAYAEDRNRLSARSQRGKGDHGLSHLSCPLHAANHVEKSPFFTAGTWVERVRWRSYERGKTAPSQDTHSIPKAATASDPLLMGHR